MPTSTTNYGLIKPGTDDPILIGQINDNMDAIDTVLKDHSDKIDAAALGIKFKGEVNYYSNLPNDAEIGDAYTVKYAGSSGTTPDGTEYVWGAVSGVNQWINFSKDSYSKAEVDALLALKQNALTTSQLAAVNSGIDSAKVAQIETNKNNILTVADQTTKYNLLNQAAYTALRNATYNNGVVTQVNADMRSNLVMQLSLYNGSTFVTQLAQSTVTTNGIVSIPFTYSQEGNLIRIGHSGANVDARIVYAIPTDFVADNKYYFVCTVNNCKQVIDDVTTPYSWQNMAIIPKAIYDSGFTSYQPYAMSNAELTAAIQAIQAQLANQ